MAKRRRPRVRNFEGKPKEYVIFLESLVNLLEEQLRVLRHQNGLPIQSTEPHSTLLVFQIETPETRNTKDQNAKGRVEWKPLLNEFTSLIPKDEEGWAARRKQVRLHKREDVLSAFHLLTRYSPQLGSLDVDNTLDSKAGILDVLEDYGRFVVGLEIHKTWAIQLSYYSSLLFVCLCIISLHAGADKDAVNDQLRQFLTELQGKKCEAGADYLSQLRSAVLWVLRRMDELEKRGMEHRSYEMFVLCGPSIHSYRKYAQIPEAKGFIDDVTICKPPDGELQADIQFSLPFLAKIILGPRYSLGSINEALKTDLPQDKFDKMTEALGERIQCLSPARNSSADHTDQRSLFAEAAAGEPRTLNESHGNPDDRPLLDTSEYGGGSAEQHLAFNLTFDVDQFLNFDAIMSESPDA